MDIQVVAGGRSANGGRVMPRKLRVPFEGAIHRVTNRGVERRGIFDDVGGLEHFLARLGDAVEEYGVRLCLFTCMRHSFRLSINLWPNPGP